MELLEHAQDYEFYSCCLKWCNFPSSKAGKGTVYLTYVVHSLFPTQTSHTVW